MSIPTHHRPLTNLHSPAALGIFAKHPVPGQVKTRLAAAWGDGRATELYAAFVADTIERFRGTADRRFLCYSPERAESAVYFNQLARGDFDLWPQPDAPLGERLEAFFRTTFAGGAERVVVIGTDSPTLPREHVEHAFVRLGGNDTVKASTAHDSPLTNHSAAAACVLGPAMDGGYCLVGLRGGLSPIFSGIEWSTPHVLTQTVARLREQGTSLALLPPWYDVDCPDDVEFLRGHLDALRCAGGAVPPRTAVLLREWPVTNAPCCAGSPPTRAGDTIAASLSGTSGLRPRDDCR